MSTQPVPIGGTMRHHVAGNVRAELARQQKKQSALARALQMSEAAVSRRTNAELAFDVDELELVAQFLDVPLSVLLFGRPGYDPSGPSDGAMRSTSGYIPRGPQRQLATAA